MGEESAMSSMSGMSGMESSQSQSGVSGAGEAAGGSKKVIIAVALLCIAAVGVGAFIMMGKDTGASGGDDDSAEPPKDSGGDSSGAPSASPSDGPSDVPVQPAGPTKLPAPQKNFVMCTVSMMFKDYAAFKDVPCDYIVFDNLLIYNDKVIPTQDYEAWAAFQSFIKSQPTPKPGISFMGAYLADMSGLVGKQPVQKALKDLFQAGVRACGVTGVDIPTVQADQAKVTSSLKTFFTALDSISEENVHYFGAFRIPKAAKFEGLAAFLGNVHIGVVITHNKLWQKIVDYDNCKIRASSSWNVEGDATFENAAYALSKVTSPDKPLGVSFSMAAYSHVISSDTTVSDTSSAFGQKCQYRSPISYQNWCRATGGTDGTTQNMAVRKFNVTSRSVVSFDTKNSMEAKIKQLKTTVKYPIGVLLADIPFDMIDGTSCGSDVSLGRVKGIADVIHS